MDGFSWKYVLIGYGVGIVIGLGIGWLMFFIGKPKCLITFVEEEGYIIVMKRDKKKKTCNRITKIDHIKKEEKLEISRNRIS
ncbi:hypothetical protein Leryth_001437 [Lithospermum erythrorhizon]|nr:hypothetical protein Leryth_001437 [Lithospermum erythrorhizon]